MTLKGINHLLLKYLILYIQYSIFYYIKSTISLIFISLAIAHVVFPEYAIDNTTIILLILAYIPWILDHIKGLELNGLGKIDFTSQKNELVSKISNDKKNITIHEK